MASFRGQLKIRIPSTLQRDLRLATGDNWKSCYNGRPRNSFAASSKLQLKMSINTAAAGAVDKVTVLPASHVTRSSSICGRSRRRHRTVPFSIHSSSTTRVASISGQFRCGFPSSPICAAPPGLPPRHTPHLCCRVQSKLSNHLPGTRILEYFLEKLLRQAPSTDVVEDACGGPSSDGDEAVHSGEQRTVCDGRFITRWFLKSIVTSKFTSLHLDSSVPRIPRLIKPSDQETPFN